VAVAILDAVAREIAGFLDGVAQIGMVRVDPGIEDRDPHPGATGLAPHQRQPQERLAPAKPFAFGRGGPCERCARAQHPVDAHG
jgi:hypothetical protein